MPATKAEMIVRATPRVAGAPPRADFALLHRLGISFGCARVDGRFQPALHEPVVRRIVREAIRLRIEVMVRRDDVRIFGAQAPGSRRRAPSTGKAAAACRREFPSQASRRRLRRTMRRARWLSAPSSRNPLGRTTARRRAAPDRLRRRPHASRARCRQCGRARDQQESRRCSDPRPHAASADTPSRAECRAL